MRSIEELLEITKNNDDWWFSDEMTNEEARKVRRYIEELIYGQEA